MPDTTKNKRKQATRKTENSRVPAWVWLFTGAVLGAFVMFLIRLSDMQNRDTSASKNTNNSEKVISPKAKPEQKPRFDFYDLLKETQIPASPPQPKKSDDKQPPARPQEYLLQVASFKSAEDADSLRAELILLNLDAQTEKAQVRNGETWHRVIIGPFSSKSKLAKARSILLANRYEALVLKREVQE